MRIIETADYDSMSQVVASLIAAEAARKPDCVLGLATGSTAIGAYGVLSQWYRSGAISFAQVRTVNLDEYVGLAPEHSHSYRYFMNEKFFNRVDIKIENTFIPNGIADDVEEECRRYDRLLKSLGGADIQLLGIGHNCHIAFNEPGPDFPLYTHKVALAQSTITANSRLFASQDEVPRYAITMGIGGIMSARRIVLAVSGKSKAPAIKRAFSGPVSIRRLHPDVVLVGDKAALSELPRGVWQW